MASDGINTVTSKKTVGGWKRLPRSVVFLVVLVAVPVIAAAPIWAEPETVEEVLGRSGYSAPQKAEVRALFGEARQDGIAEEMLLPRLAEGVAKHVPANKVLPVLRQNLAYLREARSILQGIAGGAALLNSRSSWLRTANLLASGVPTVEIREIAEASLPSTEDYRQATALHVTLVDWGLSRPDSLRLVKALLLSSIPAESFAGVPELLAAGRRLRISPEELIHRIQEYLPEVDSLEQLQERLY